ncbi:MAG: hypothetical protein OXF07_05010 [Rhodobacter sp.]|nr:hypothetical protein [Rhodobacter sp.]MCY4167831.1 hypothetical protein [Rhodobacter sp.]MCY4240591.1 hypothetical protein [Rhodobacter sp.]
MNYRRDAAINALMEALDRGGVTPLRMAGYPRPQRLPASGT